MLSRVIIKRRKIIYSWNFCKREYFDFEDEWNHNDVTSSKSHLSNSRREYIDGYELQLSERLTRACRSRFARTNC